MKPVAFIGSSGLKYEVVEALADGLLGKLDPHPWREVFQVGEVTLSGLVREANAADFGIFIFGADDRIGTAFDVPRDNVVYEAGLFSGILGTDRSLVVHEEGVKIPSDLEGITVARFARSANPAEIAAAVCPALLRTVHELGPKRFLTVAGTLEGDWWQYSLAADGGVERSKVAFLRFRRTRSGYLALSGQAWTGDGDALSSFTGDLSVLHEDDQAYEYRWKGRWFVPRDEIDADPAGFYGRGEFRLSPGNKDRASGYFTTRNDSNPELDDQTPVDFRRAESSDILTMDGHDRQARQALIRERLAER